MPYNIPMQKHYWKFGTDLITYFHRPQHNPSMRSLNRLCFILFLSITIFYSPCHSQIQVEGRWGENDRNECVYTVYVRTGSILKAGTDSIITLTLYNAVGEGLRIRDVEAWGGLMGPGYDYFERGNLDIFSGRGPCLSSPICAMNLTSDGSGPHHGWYCNYVELTSTGAHIPCSQKLFTVDQWLATDASPYQLTAIRDSCSSSSSDLDHSHRNPNGGDRIRSSLTSSK